MFFFRNFKSFQSCQLYPLSTIVRQKGAPVQFKTNNKIKINQLISSIRSTDMFMKVYEDSHWSFNLINYTTYLRKFTDMQIELKSLQSIKIEGHLSRVVLQLMVYLQQEESGSDGIRDITRSYSMIISACGEVSKHVRQPLKQKIIELAIIANSNLDPLLLEMNEYEMANYFRGMSWLVIIGCKDLLTKSAQRLSIDIIEKYQIQSVIKIYHSLVELADIQLLIELIRIIRMKFKEEKINNFDIQSIYASFNAKIPSDLYISLYTETAQTIMSQNIIPNSKTIAIIYNRYANLIHLLPQDKDFFSFLERNLMNQSLSYKGFAHILNFYSRSQLTFPFNERKLHQTISQFKDQISFDLLVVVLQSLLKLNAITPPLLKLFLDQCRKCFQEKQKHEDIILLYFTLSQIQFYDTKEFIEQVAQQFYLINEFVSFQRLRSVLIAIKAHKSCQQQVFEKMIQLLGITISESKSLDGLHSLVCDMSQNQIEYLLKQNSLLSERLVQRSTVKEMFHQLSIGKVLGINCMTMFNTITAEEQKELISQFERYDDKKYLEYVLKSIQQC